MKNHVDISGWFDYAQTYDFLVSTIPDNGIFVECGAWLGKSSSYLCDLAKDRVIVYIVDSWEGSPSELDTTQKLAISDNIYDIFISNMGDRKFIPIKLPSIEACRSFDDHSCDVVFIDMSHTYEDVKQDIDSWMPKVKQNGYIAGHDYQKDWPDVIRAVNEKFGANNLQLMDTCWIYHNK